MTLSDPDEGQQITLADLQMIIGAKEIELQRLRAAADSLINRLQSEKRVLQAEIQKLRGTQASEDV